MKKLLVLSGIFIALNLQSYAQYGYYDDPEARFGKKEEKNKEPKWVFGGNFWLSFGQSTYVDVEPIAGYRVTPRFIVGGGPMYIYEKYNSPIDRKISAPNGSFFYETAYKRIERHIWGGRAMMQYAIIPDLSELLNTAPLRIILQTEYEHYYLKPFYIDQTQYTTSNNSTILENYYDKRDKAELVQNWLIGAGISQPLGPRAYLTITVMYDITQHPQSFQSNPIISVGIGI